MSVYYRVLWLHPLMTVAFHPLEEPNLSGVLFVGEFSSRVVAEQLAESFSKMWPDSRFEVKEVSYDGDY